MAIATTWIEYQIDSGLKFLETQQTPEAHTNTEHHPVSEVVAALENLFKIGSDADAHKAAIDTPLVSLENQHQTDATVPAHALAGPTLTIQASMEKVSDLSIISINASSTSDFGHGPVPSLAGPDALTPVQSIVPEAASANVFSQADHSPSLPQSSAQTAAAPAAPSSVSSTSTDAYHALATDLTSSNLNVSIVSVGDFVIRGLYPGSAHEPTIGRAGTSKSPKSRPRLHRASAASRRPLEFVALHIRRAR